MPAFAVPSSLRPLLFRPVIRVICMFPWPLMCQLFLLLGLFAGMVVCKFLSYAGPGADQIQEVVDSLEEVSRGKLFSFFQGWPCWSLWLAALQHIKPQFFWAKAASCVVGSKREYGVRFCFGKRDNGPEGLMGFIRAKLFLWTSVTCHKYCESGSRGCLAGCSRASSFSQACDWEISAKVGNTTFSPYLMEGRGILHRKQLGLVDSLAAKGRASLAMRTRLDIFKMLGLRCDNCWLHKNKVGSNVSRGPRILRFQSSKVPGIQKLQEFWVADFQGRTAEF